MIDHSKYLVRAYYLDDEDTYSEFPLDVQIKPNPEVETVGVASSEVPCIEEACQPIPE